MRFWRGKKHDPREHEEPTVRVMILPPAPDPDAIPEGFPEEPTETELPRDTDRVPLPEHVHEDAMSVFERPTLIPPPGEWHEPGRDTVIDDSARYAALNSLPPVRSGITLREHAVKKAEPRKRRSSRS